MEGIFGLVSFGISLCTTLATLYFWIVRSNQERPRLKVYKAEPAFGGYAPSSCGETIKLILEIKAIVANCSALPNSLIGVRTWVKMRDGSWKEADTAVDPKNPLPMNLPSRQTVRLNLSATVAVPAIPEGDACKNTHETYALYRERCLPASPEVKVELNALEEQRFREVLTSVRRAA
jgi:hypothetical protein